jgi:RNA polymerase sigma-70 factor (ECF subfamily)
MRGGGPEDFRAALETLCTRYLAPVTSYARAAWARSDEDAQDLAQEFFAWLLDGEVLRRYAPDQGSFRAYLKGVLRNFERNQAQARRRLKRGGGARPVSLDQTGSPLAAGVADRRAEDPALAFDRAWVAALTDQAVRRLRERAASDKRWARRFAVFEAYDLVAESDRPTYAVLAERSGLTEGEVRNALFLAREALRDQIRAELSDTVADARSLEEEWRALVGS